MDFLDAHLHFFSSHWPGESDWPKRYGECLPPDYCKTSEVARSRNVIAVEASADPIEDQNLLQLAEKTTTITGFIANLQPLRPGFAERVDAFSQCAKLKGIRLRPIESFDLTSDEILEALKPLRSKGLTLEFGAKTTDRLGQVSEFASRLGDLKIVLTHSGHPPINSTQIDQTWRRSMQAIARHLHCFVKLTPLDPLATGIDPASASAAFANHRRVIVDLFGPERVLFGSNWPLSASAGTPDQHAHELADDIALSEADSRWVFKETARHLYR